MLKKVYYRVVWPNRSFADENFMSKGEALDFMREYIDGCPKNRSMKIDDRAYWSDLGKQLRLFKVTETMKPETVGFKYKVFFEGDRVKVVKASGSHKKLVGKKGLVESVGSFQPGYITVRIGKNRVHFPESFLVVSK